MVSVRIRISFLTGVMATASLTFAPSADAAQAAHPWSVVPSPDQGSVMDRLASVSCASPKSCMAVGYWDKASPTNEPQTLAEVWSGSTWSLTPSPNEGKYGDVLNGVFCRESTSCIAVGDSVSYSSSSEDFKTLVESWNGTSWSVIPSPNHFNSSLYGVSCVSATRCVAVGGHGKKIEPLAELWNGTSWSISSAPNPKGGGNLGAVSCFRSNDCIAVGGDGSVGGTLVESWNGHAWSIVQSPNPAGDQFDAFSGVSCSSSYSCIAVGSYFYKGNARTLSESWNGAKWSIIRTPNQKDSHIDFLASVSCASPTDCIGVGSGNESLIESWNGTAWTMVAGPNQGGGGLLYGISCPTEAACVAAGFYETVKTEIDKTLIESD
jgi:hypothetical protein